MSAQERERLTIIKAVGEKRLKQGQAAERLGLSVRQIKRLVKAHRQEGAKGLVSRRRGRASHRRIAQAERDHMIGLIARHYADFGPTWLQSIYASGTALRAR